MIREGAMTFWSGCTGVLFSCTCLCLSCDGARNSREPERPVARVEHSLASSGSGGAEGKTRAEEPLPSKARPVTLSNDQATVVEVSGPGSDVLVVHVQVTQSQAWDPFSVRVLDSKQATLGAFVVPYSSGDNSFSLRVTGSSIAQLKTNESAQLQASSKLLEPGGVFPRQ